MIETRFKDTEIGKIPEEWGVKDLRSFLSLLTDYDANGSFADMASNVKTTDGYGYAWYVRATDLEQNTKLSKVKYTDESSYNFLKKSSLHGGEVLVAKRGEIGKVYYFEMKTQKATLAPNLYLLKLNNNIYPYYLFLYLKYGLGNKLLKSINASTSLGAIYKEDVKDIKVIVPTVSEQRRIATSLSDVDALIAAVEKKIEKKKLIKQGAMQQLLTGKRKLPGYEGEWVEKRLGEVGKLDRNSINPKLEPNKIFYEYSMPAYDIGRQPIKCLGDTMNSNRFIVKGEMLLFNKLNVRQKRIWLIDPHNDNSVCSQEFLPFTSTKVCLEYIAQLVATDWVTDAFIEKSKGTSNSQKRISPNDFLDYEISIPSDPSEQRAIASILSNMDSEITALERKRDKLKELKQGMMQQLLTGKIRLVRCSG